jgi:hypothetical protein
MDRRLGLRFETAGLVWVVQFMPNDLHSKLCPAQKRAFDYLTAGLQLGSILRLWSGVGRGKTTILKELHKQTGGIFLNMKDFVEASAKTHPLALEETLYRLIFDALRSHQVVIMDDLHLLDLYSAGCHFYPRSGYFNSIMMGLCTYALESGKKLVFSTGNHLAEAAEQRSYSFGIDKFKVEDYESLVATFRGEPAKELDFEKIFRFAPKLNAHQLKAACQWLVNPRERRTGGPVPPALKTRGLALRTTRHGKNHSRAGAGAPSQGQVLSH